MSTELEAALERLRSRMFTSGGNDVSLMAVTKGHPAEAAIDAIGAGLVRLGENYAQELVAKSDVVKAAGLSPQWHFIGRLQRNKVKHLAGLVTRWDSVDRARLLVEIAKRDPGAAVLVQVNVTEEPSKAGCSPGDTAGLVDQAQSLGLDVQGLMTIGRTGNTEDARPGFAILRSLCDELDLGVCSMGMSHDLEAAISEGSTLVRVGTALFGPRDVVRD